VESAADSPNTINGNLPVDINDRQVLLNIILIKDEDRNSIIVILNDVSDRKLVQEALDQSEEQYQRLVEISPNTILVHHEGKIHYVNPAGVKLFGASGPQDLIGRPYLDLVHPDDRAGSKERMKKMIKEGSIAPFREHRFITLDGKVIDIESIGTTFKYQGKIMIQAIIHDITERKKAEEEKTRLASQLLQTQKMEAIGTLAGGIAHDFNNLLMGIQGHTSLMLMDVDSSHPMFELGKSYKTASWFCQGRKV
jgi:PAS domain S-box-containing protein